MMNELLAQQRYRLYDGQWLVPECDTGGSLDLERLRAAAAERRVDCVVLELLTAFTSEQKKKGMGAPFFLLGGFSRRQSELTVSMRFRISDVRSGEIVASATGDGIGRRRATAVGALGIVHGLPLGAIAGAARAHSARNAM